MAEPEIKIGENRAQQGIKLGHMRYVLMISLALAIIALIVVSIVTT